MKPVPKPKRIGRPPKLTLETAAAIGHLIGLGMTEEQACLVEEVNLKSFQSAKLRKPEFAGAIKKAQVAFLKTALDAISNGGKLEEVGGEIKRAPWQGLAWILERRHRPQFSRIEGSVVLGGEGFALSDEEFKRLGALAREMFGGKPA